jgi:hypothetical protein
MGRRTQQGKGKRGIGTLDARIKSRLDRLIDFGQNTSTEIALRLGLYERGIKHDTLMRYMARRHKRLGRAGLPAGRPRRVETIIEAVAMPLLLTLEAMMPDALVDGVLARIAAIRQGGRCRKVRPLMDGGGGMPMDRHGLRSATAGVRIRNRSTRTTGEARLKVSRRPFEKR